MFRHPLEFKEVKMASAACASCETQIEVGRKPVVGQRVTCPSCDEVMEVVWLQPVELDWAIDEDDYDDDEDDYDYDEEEG
jgi:hypothetical protein